MPNFLTGKQGRHTPPPRVKKVHQVKCGISRKGNVEYDGIKAQIDRAYENWLIRRGLKHNSFDDFHPSPT